VCNSPNSPPQPLHSPPQQQQQQQHSVSEKEVTTDSALKKRKLQTEETIEEASLFDAHIPCGGQFCFFNPSTYSNEIDNPPLLFPPYSSNLSSLFDSHNSQFHYEDNFHFSHDMHHHDHGT
jgi:hypothetical protein